MKVANLKPTRGVSRENFIFRGLLEVSVWDLGGQDIYLERHLSDKQKPIIFGDVDVAVFMVDTTVKEPVVRTILDRFLEALWEYSPHIEKVYVLLNKIDLEGSMEDDLFEILTQGLAEEYRQKTAFTPVSVKEGSAQHRLIEILDFEIQKSTLSMQRLSKIRSILDKLKGETGADLLLFNRPDGLLFSSTFGKFSLEPFEYMKFEIGTLDSNLYQIYQKIYQIEKKIPISPLLMSSIIYESEENYVIVREISDKAVLMVMTASKDDGLLNKILDAFRGQSYEELKKFIRASAI